MAEWVGRLVESIVAKLNEVIADSYTDLLVVSRDIVFLKEELLSMNALLVRLDDHHHYYELNQQEKLWRTETRRMAYDIEDCIDDFMNNNVAGADATGGFLAKVSQFINTLRAHFEAAKQIKELKARIADIHERRKRYRVEFDSPNNTANKVDPRILSLYNESGSLVGIDVPKENLMQWVLDEEKRLKVLPIVGFGGLGKTTLANEVYREVGRQFDGKAFVSISQKPDMRKVLRSVLLQLGQHPSSHACDVVDLITDLRNYLQDKRYIIVIDDLWDVTAWNVVICAFPANEKHSRIITTTRDESVARSCASDHRCIYKMRHLNEQDSRRLFFNRIFGFEHHCPPEFTEVSCAILKKCGGLPLAIITIASILACQPTNLKEQWDNIQKSLVSEEFATNPTLETMMHILDLSFKSLPHHLRACFMYLGTYPGYHKISKVELIRRWVAEGLVGNSQGGYVWDVAESYFNELVNRSMVQPGYEDDNMKISYCTVHDMMFELIARRCREDDFVSLVVDPHVLANGQNNIRRLTIDLSNVDDGIMDVTNTEWLSQVRSLAICGGGSKWRPSLLEFKFLRVLFLEFIKAEVTIDLTCITHLLQLKYLKVKCEECSEVPTIVLPEQIGRLRHLETLEMPRVSICNIPSDIDKLSHLSHLVLPWNAKLPDRIGNVKSLRTLSGFNLSMSSLENINCLGKLSNLEDMYLNCDLDYTGCPMERMTALAMSLQKFDRLKYLCVHSSYVNCRADALSSWSCPPFLELKELDVVRLTFSEVPKWIGRLYNITDLRLGVKKMLQKDISVIGTKLPSLVFLRLRVTGVPAERILIGGSTGFSLLKSFDFDCDGVSCLTFEEGAMPSLRTLCFGLDAREWDGGMPHGLHYLTSLKEVQVWTKRQYQQTRSENPLMKDMFHNAVLDLPSGPAFILHKGLLTRCREVGSSNI